MAQSLAVLCKQQGTSGGIAQEDIYGAWDGAVKHVLLGKLQHYISGAETEAQRNATSASRSGGQQDDIRSLQNCRANPVLTREAYG